MYIWYIYIEYIYIYMNILYQAGSNYGLKSSLMFRSMLLKQYEALDQRNFQINANAGGVFWSAGSQQSRGPRIIIREGLHYISTVAVGMIPGQWIFHLVSPADLTMGGNIFTGNIGIFPWNQAILGWFLPRPRAMPPFQRRDVTGSSGGGHRRSRLCLTPRWLF